MQTFTAIQNQLLKAHSVIDLVFREILPKNGLGVREAQVQLSHDMLDALHHRMVALTDAGVGIGKTYAYLVAVIAQHLYLPESMWVRSSYRHDVKFNMTTPMPVIISTSSIALQKAIIHEYIPFLSNALLKNGIINEPLQCVIRKGKSNYVCDMLLRTRLADVRFKLKNPKQREALLSLSSNIDLNKVQGLSSHDRKQICVPSYCSRKCCEAYKCRYQHLLKSAKSPDIFFQICNHNYLIADTMHRKSGKEPLLPNYKAVVIDEAHKLSDTAQQMYGEVLVEEDILMLSKQARMAGIKTKKFESQLIQLGLANGRYFSELESNVAINPDEDIQCFEYAPVKEVKAKLFDLIMALKIILEELQRREIHTLEGRFEAMKDRLYLFYRREVAFVRHIEYTAETKCLSLCAIPKNLKKQLSDDLWSMPVPFILTSGTLAVNGNFDRTRDVLGIEGSNFKKRIIESTALSPFDYKKNCLLHLPDDVPYPDIENSNYLEVAAKKIINLVHATYGHTLVLFTSYKMMSEVGKRVKMQSLPSPLLIAWKDNHQILGAFKSLDNAILFATGTYWEGVDFPGDMVSSLIIVTLPFHVPDPLSRYEQLQYPTLSEFISTSVVPDMQKKLKQGFGRAIRTETDTCVVTILDSRARDGGKYHQAVLNALPQCQMTCEISHVAGFIRHMKDQQYFSVIKEVI